MVKSKPRSMRRRKGMTLIELLGVMVVLVVLAAIAIGGVMNSVYRSRVTSCLTAIDGYRSAFLNAAVSHPSVFSDRINHWGDGSNYSSKDGLKRIVAFMNEALDDNLQFYWNDEMKWYESVDNDPWGGKYILTEYPVSDNDPTHNYYDASKDANGYKMFACSIWATGNNEVLTNDDPTIARDSYGVGLLFADGIVTPNFNGFNSKSPYEGYKLIYK